VKHQSALFDLSGKAVLVTGAGAGGLGYHSAVALAEHGADVFVSDVAARSSDLERTAAAIRASGKRSGIAFCDVSDEFQVDALVDAALAAIGRIDVLVHHAGVMLRGDTFGTSLGDWQRVIDVNLTGTWLVDRRVAREMVRNGGGKIVNTSTVYDRMAGPIPESAYYASKAGIANLTRGLAVEWGRQNVTVNCVAPGVFYPTNMTAPLATDPERLEWFANRTACGRLGNPERDLKGAIVFLAAPASDYVTGQIIYVDGGWTAW
jgi:NAD(P)-dependent dehydrogenase (short-subunit alcohol dehydrogenase family)